MSDTSNPPQSAPNTIDSLDEILTKLVHPATGDKSYPGQRARRAYEAKQAIRHLCLTETLELIGEDKQITGYKRPNGIMNVDLTESYRSSFRAELRAAAQEKWSK